MATGADVRRIATVLSAYDREPSSGTPGFRIADRLFARIHEQPGTARRRVADEGEKRALLAEDPHRFTTTPHDDGHPMVLVRLEHVDEAELTELLTDAWAGARPAELLREEDSSE